jgi:hypothetical protein
MFIIILQNKRFATIKCNENNVTHVKADTNYGFQEYINSSRKNLKRIPCPLNKNIHHFYIFLK